MMKTRYEFFVDAHCPVDGSEDEYEATLVWTGKYALKVEEILAAVAELTAKPILQEDLTHAHHRRFNATVTTRGDHSGIYVTCCSDPNERI